jgi:hypothetical protein
MLTLSIPMCSSVVWMCLMVLIEFGPKLTVISPEIRTSSFIWKKFLGHSNCPFCRMAGITLNRHSALRVITLTKQQIQRETTQIELRKCIAFCAPGLHRGQFLCQFSLFFVFPNLVNFPSWNPFKTIVFDDLDLPGPPQIDPDQIWGTSFFHHFHHFWPLKKYQFV